MLMVQGKTIRLYLVDGVPTGMLTAEIINWTGKVIVSSRAQLPGLAVRDEAKRTGIYCLIGEDPENLSHDCVYIGESDDVLTRLTEHNRDVRQRLDFWTRSIIVISKDQNITKSHARYLEARLIQMVHAAGRATLINGTSPPAPPLPEPDIADMEYFLEQIQLILPVLGFSFLRPKPSSPPDAPLGTNAPPIFRLEAVGVKATAREVDDEFVVLKGSMARRQGTPSWRDSYKNLRDYLRDDRKLVEASDPELLVFTEDIPFSSPSTAANIVLARSANGRTEWKEDTTGKSYAEWQELQLRT